MNYYSGVAAILTILSDNLPHIFFFLNGHQWRKMFLKQSVVTLFNRRG